MSPVPLSATRRPSTPRIESFHIGQRLSEFKRYTSYAVAENLHSACMLGPALRWFAPFAAPCQPLAQHRRELRGTSKVMQFLLPSPRVHSAFVRCFATYNSFSPRLKPAPESSHNRGPLAALVGNVPWRARTWRGTNMKEGLLRSTRTSRALKALGCCCTARAVRETWMARSPGPLGPPPHRRIGPRSPHGHRHTTRLLPNCSSRLRLPFSRLCTPANLPDPAIALRLESQGTLFVTTRRLQPQLPPTGWSSSGVRGPSWQSCCRR